MNILHVMPDIDKEASGPSYSVRRLCESMIEAGEEAQIALIGKPTDFAYIRSFPPGIGPVRLGNSPALHRWLTSTVAGGTVDIVHNHSLWMMPNVYPGWATRKTDVPYVVSPRGTLSAWAMGSGSRVKTLFWPLVQRASLTHAACFHATSHAEYEDIRRMAFRQPVSIIPNGIDIPAERVAPSGPRKKLLFLGRLHPVKGVDFLLRSWSLLEREFPDWDLEIVGPTESATAAGLMQLSRDLGLSRVVFLGAVYGPSKMDHYRSADLYVLPSHSENFAVTVAEALSCGVPTVVSRGAPWSGLEANGAGWWPEIGYEPLLAALRSAMVRPREELIEMGHNGRRWMQEEFGWPGIAARMIQTYAWLAGTGSRPSCVELG